MPALPRQVVLWPLAKAPVVWAVAGTVGPFGQVAVKLSLMSEEVPESQVAQGSARRVLPLVWPLLSRERVRQVLGPARGVTEAGEAVALSEQKLMLPVVPSLLQEQAFAFRRFVQR